MPSCKNLIDDKFSSSHWMLEQNNEAVIDREYKRLIS